MVKFKNIKDIYTDLIGAVIMGFASYKYFLVEPAITDTQFYIALAVGFVLLWMSDKEILDFLRKLIRSKVKESSKEEDKEDKPE